MIRQHQRRWRWLLMLLAVGCSAGIVAGHAAEPATAGAMKASALPAKERNDIRAQLLPRQFTTIAAEIGAKVSRITVAEGGAFKAGQLLLRFDCSLQQELLEKARAEHSAAELTNNANKRLIEMKSIGQIEADLSRVAVSRAAAEVRVQQVVLAKCSIPAPFSGRISEQKVREQQYVQPGQALLDIIDDSVLELEFLVPSHWLGWLRVGQPLQVEIDETRRSYPAKFIRLGARVDPVSQSIKVAAAINGRFPDLVAGMSGKIQITPPAASSASR
ncbi:MAG: efflux RND transporter periplasmic adaptor subunit [Pseudomonadota bacterium]